MEQIQTFRPNETNQNEAGVVAKWTQESKWMLPKSEAEILGLFSRGWSILVKKVTDEEELVVAHAAITYEWGVYLELGAVVTEINHRKRGLARIAVLGVLGMIRENFPEKRVMALCNDMSLPIFVGLGGQVISGKELPGEVWSECEKCPKYKLAKERGQVCCDTPVDMTEVGIVRKNDL